MDQAWYAFAGAALVAALNGISAVWSAHRADKRAREDREAAREAHLFDKRREAFEAFLQAVEAIREGSGTIEQLRRAHSSVALYGSDHASLPAKAITDQASLAITQGVATESRIRDWELEDLLREFNADLRASGDASFDTLRAEIRNLTHDVREGIAARLKRRRLRMAEKRQRKAQRRRLERQKAAESQ